MSVAINDVPKQLHGLEYVLEDQFRWRMNLIMGWLDGYYRNKIKQIKAQFLEPDVLAAMMRVERFL